MALVNGRLQIVAIGFHGPQYPRHDPDTALTLEGFAVRGAPSTSEPQRLEGMAAYISSSRAHVHSTTNRSKRPGIPKQVVNVRSFIFSHMGGGMLAEGIHEAVGMDHRQSFRVRAIMIPCFAVSQVSLFPHIQSGLSGDERDRRDTYQPGLTQGHHIRVVEDILAGKRSWITAAEALDANPEGVHISPKFLL
jgi:hypothetical protein